MYVFWLIWWTCRWWRIFIYNHKYIAILVINRDKLNLYLPHRSLKLSLPAV
jgi:hypothetical protein